MSFCYRCDHIRQKTLISVGKNTHFHLIFQLNRDQAEEELDRLSKTMGYMEKGKIRVKGLLEGEAMPVPVAPAEAAPVAGVEEGQMPTPQETEA